MRVLMVSKALVVGAYQRKLEELAALPGIELSVAVPPSWREQGHEMRLTRSYTEGYSLLETPIRLNGHYHVHYYPELPALLDRLRPDVLHIDEEPYNLATWLAIRAAERRGILSLFYAWQNILQRYPPPFRWLEADVLRRAALGIAGNKDGAEVLRAKGYAGPMRVIRQFGIDPELFRPSSRCACRGAGVPGGVRVRSGPADPLQGFARADRGAMPACGRTGSWRCWGRGRPRPSAGRWPRG